MGQREGLEENRRWYEGKDKRGFIYKDCRDKGKSEKRIGDGTKTAGTKGRMRRGSGTKGRVGTGSGTRSGGSGMVRRLLGQREQL